MSAHDLPLHAVLHGPPLPPRLAARRLCDNLLGAGSYKPEALHCYTDVDGAPHFWRIRVRLPDGTKWIRPMRRDGMIYAVGEPEFGAGGKPLYRLHEIARAPAAAPAWFVEGELCADAIAKLGLLATTAGGASSDEQADFERLRGRRVIIWPDNDRPGTEHGERVAAKLRALGANVETIDVEALRLPAGGDVVDWLRAHPGATADDLDQLPRVREPAAAQAAREHDAEAARSGMKEASRVIEPEAQYPSLDAVALYGLAGDLVRAIEPQTEADPVALLMQTIAAFGVLVGRGPHYRVEADEHHAQLFVLLVGETSKGRKGTSWGRVRQIFERVPEWPRVVDGLSSGEGVKWAVRDPLRRVERDKSGAAVEVEVDAGVADKRLLVFESEFAQVLRQTQRSGNTLSATLRSAWDTGRLAALTKNDPVAATGAHIAIVGHITADELRAELAAIDLANGFANRFLYCCTRRSKVLPFGGEPLPEDRAARFAERIAQAAQHARRLGAIPMTKAARETWAAVYPAVSAGYPGLLGAVTARAEAQCVRLALLYALMDCAHAIDKPHLLAALALWEYAEASARYIFGDSLGDPVADEILRALRAAGADGLTRTAIRDLFARHQSAERIGAALALLERRKLALREARGGEAGGRPAEVWRST